MQIVSTRTHGMIDYIFGILLVVSPWLFGFADDGAAMWVPIVIGVAVLGQAMMTRYELGMVKVIPMPMHLGVDIAAGLVLIVSPWLFGFASTTWIPHVVLGIVAVATALVTERTPGHSAAAS